VVGPAEVIADRVDKLPGEGPPASVGRPGAGQPPGCPARSQDQRIGSWSSSSGISEGRDAPGEDAALGSEERICSLPGGQIGAQPASECCRRFLIGLELLASEQTQQVAEAVARLTEFVLVQFFTSRLSTRRSTSSAASEIPLSKTAVTTQIG
jgi:hypothetical protein